MSTLLAEACAECGHGLPEDCAPIADHGEADHLTGKSIVCIASGWDCHPTSKHHVMRRLSQHNHVVWVNWHASRRPSVHLADLRAIRAKLGQIRQGPRPVSPTMTVVTPGQLPFPGSALARRLNASIVRRSVRKVLAELPPRPVQLWSFAPDASELVGGFDEELVLYYCVDAFGEFPGYNRELIEQRERELIARSDLVITTSPPLYEAKQRLHPNVHLVQHGVDHGHLSRAVTQDLPVPDDLRDLPRPIFGFVGVIGQWVDVDLVAGLAKRWPRASIVMIGPVIALRGPRPAAPNLHWLGEKDHAVLPQYLRYFDVGLIPFKQVPLTHNANPIKLYEYLAAGVPVVSSTLPTVRAMPGSVWLADHLASTANACAQAVQHNDADARQCRSNLMMAESWTARLQQITALANQALRTRSTKPTPRTTPPVTQRCGIPSA